MCNPLDKRWCVVLELQQSLQHLTPGSLEAEVAEHAISLAINSRNSEQNLKFFRYDLIRNARFSLKRTKARQHRLWQKVASATPAWAEDTTPYASSELESQLRLMLSKSGKQLNQCFTDMLDGKSVASTAKAYGISHRTAIRLRQKVRQIVQAYLDAQEVA
ncbi:hypothetical protein OsccyDRAFT_3528 [Leptolyngbyaceae cyanobacterium JSC-12]|nr:hypothetical protein OsccyDRAFT_3528 [Leptolyngbyaceae cyanobacterium JSC-12]